MITRRKHKQEMMIHGQRHVSAELLAPMVDLTAWYIRDLARNGKIPYEQIRSKKFFNPTEVEKFLNKTTSFKPLAISKGTMTGNGPQVQNIPRGLDILNF